MTKTIMPIKVKPTDLGMCIVNNTDPRSGLEELYRNVRSRQSAIRMSFGDLTRIKPTSPLSSVLTAIVTRFSEILLQQNQPSFYMRYT